MNPNRTINQLEVDKKMEMGSLSKGEYFSEHLSFESSHGKEIQSLKRFQSF